MMSDPIYAPAWTALANCAATDPEAFFPTKGSNSNIKTVKAVCSRCEVRAECLEYALRHHERHGIWGGLSERQRRGMEAA